MEITSRVVIIDNYDSFTFNLVQRVFDAVGERPLVVRNDDYEFIKVMKDYDDLKVVFDLIILSPGPGNPTNDIGPVTEFILRYFLGGDPRPQYPVLFGVCMGYEAIGAKLGVDVIKTVPRHGVQWDIIVERDPICCIVFQDLPSRFKQVRYHSLILDPDQLESSADLIVTSRCLDVDPSAATNFERTEGPEPPLDTCPEWLRKLSLSTVSQNGGTGTNIPPLRMIPMSFRHKSLPVFGVQFHPESILSEFGNDIIRNICKYSKVQTKDYCPSDSVICEPKINCQLSRLIHTVPNLADLDSWSFELFRQLVYVKDHTNVWLDSPVASTGRWSFFAGGQLSKAARREASLFSVYQLDQGTWKFIDGRNLGFKFSTCEEFLTLASSLIESELGHGSGVVVPLTVPCVFTVIGYEASDALFVITDRVIAIDNDSGNVYALHVDGDDDWLDLAAIRSLERESESFPLPTPPEGILNFSIRDSKWSYIEKINACKAAIEHGESYELCLTTQVEAVLGIDPLGVYEHLRVMNPAHNSCFIQCQDQTLLMASPERFLKVDGSTGTAQVKPIKGTRRRGATPEEDDAIITELRSSEKDLAENLMIVDLVRNDLSTVCLEVKCPKLMYVESYTPYHQLVSTVEGRLPSRKRLIETIFRLFPAGSMTGAPKVRSMQILEAIEGKRRGLGYSGTVGYLCPRSGHADFAVTIRSILFKDHRVSIGCGGAILALSDPEDEWREMILKAKRSIQVLCVAANSKGALLEYSEQSECMFIRAPTSDEKNHTVVTTMRYERQRGVWLFQRHLERLWKSTGKGDKDSLRDAIIASMHKEAQTITCEMKANFNDFHPIDEGPFEGIGSMEWTQIDPGLNVEACRIRLEVQCSEPEKVTCSISPLRYDPVVSCSLSRIRVDSGDVALRRKTMDWYVPEVDTRAHYLLADEAGKITETGIANVTIRKEGRWVTPCGKSSCLLPGTLRELLIERGYLSEDIIAAHDIRSVQSSFICLNALRGAFKVSLE